MLSVTVIIWVWIAAGLLQLSTRDQVRVIIFEPGHWPFSITSTYVACMSVEQLSASFVTSPVTSIEAIYVQSTEVNISILAGAVNVGGVVSTIANIAVELELLPLASVAVNVTEAIPVEPQSLLSSV